MTTFDVEVVLKGRDFAVRQAVTVPHGAPDTWDEAAVYDVLVETLRAIDRVQNPNSPHDRSVVLTGFSWIVEPEADKVVIAMEIPMGAGVAGPFAVAQEKLDSLITNVIKMARQTSSSTIVH